ncbi:hypothetical protein ACLOJK_019916 [Asimina triloba]
MERRIGGMILLFALLISSLPISESSKKLNSVARKEDIPFIKCQVCQQLANQLYQQVNKKRAQISPKKISELQIIELTENACNLKKEEADWILRMDIVEKGDALELVEQDAEGQCNSECKTIERACQEVMGYYDTDVAEFLYKSKLQLDSLVNFLCDDLSKACSVKPPPVPKGMPGAPGMKMYSRDDLMNMQNFGDEDGDEDDEDDDGFPSKMGKVLRDQESTKTDWKQKITEGLRDSGTEIRRRLQKASSGIKQWWKGKKAALKSSSKAAEL